MDFSKWNPKTWFRREVTPPTPPIVHTPPAPPVIPRAEGQPRYKSGQRCLILRCPGTPQKIGKETILVEPVPAIRPAGNWSKTLPVWSWVTDLSEPIARYQGQVLRQVFPEKDLLPLDDEKIDEELLKEERDKFDRSQLELQKNLQLLDKAILDLQKALEQKRQRQIEKE